MDLFLASDERQLARQALVARLPHVGVRRVHLRRLHADFHNCGPLPRDLLIELPGRRLGLDAELTLQNTDAHLVLAKRGCPPAQLGMETHDRAMERLLQRIDGKQPKRCLQRGLRRAHARLMVEQLRERVDGPPVQPLALREEPVLERHLLQAEAFE